MVEWTGDGHEFAAAFLQSQSSDVEALTAALRSVPDDKVAGIWHRVRNAVIAGQVGPRKAGDDSAIMIVATAWGTMELDRSDAPLIAKARALAAVWERMPPDQGL